jgi:hypothetical protein
LFGGNLNTQFGARVSFEPQPLRIAERFSGLSAALAAARSQAPIPSASGAFRFAWDPDVRTFVRSDQSLGPNLAERAQTLGRHTGTIGLSYTRVDFDTLEGDQLDELHSSQPVFSADFLEAQSEEDKAVASDDMLVTRLDFALAYDLLFLTAAYGITDSLDLSLALSLNQVRMRGTAFAEIQDPDGDDGPFRVRFAPTQPGVSGSCLVDFRCARDGFGESVFGTGDLFLRTKWHFADTTFADLAVAGVLTLPTGNADDFLGFHDPTFTPWLIGSKTFGRLAPHLNVGYSFRSGADVSQAQWIAGADFLAAKWLTLASDFLGFHDDKRDGTNDDVLQSAVGFKINPFGDAVIGATFQFPLNRDGLRADVIYTGQVEYTF